MFDQIFFLQQVGPCGIITLLTWYIKVASQAAQRKF